MAEFLCRYGNLSGEILEKTYIAESEKNLRLQMEQQGYYIFGIKRRVDVAALARTFLKRKRRKISGKEFQVFNQELAALVHSGLPLLRCLELLMDRAENPEFG